MQPRTGVPKNEIIHMHMFWCVFSPHMHLNVHVYTFILKYTIKLLFINNKMKHEITAANFPFRLAGSNAPKLLPEIVFDGDLVML